MDYSHPFCCGHNFAAYTSNRKVFCENDKEIGDLIELMYAVFLEGESELEEQVGLSLTAPTSIVRSRAVCAKKCAEILKALKDEQNKLSTQQRNNEDSN